MPLAAWCGHCAWGCLPWRPQIEPTPSAPSRPKRQPAPVAAASPAAPLVKAHPRSFIRTWNWALLEGDGPQCEQRAALCEAFKTNGFAVIEASAELQHTVAEMFALSAEFFDLPKEDRHAMGRLRLFREKVIGYRELGGGTARFLEVHTMAGGRAIPAPRVPKSLGPTAVKLHYLLQSMARTLLTWLAEHVGVPPFALLQCLDGAQLEDLEAGDCSASVLRLGCYGYEPGMEDASGADPGCTAEEDKGEQVLFDEHTDASFLTLAPVGRVPGLQIRSSPGGGWLEVERDFCGQPGRYLVVFIGDFCEVLTKGTYTAACHRVAQELPCRRLSMPFLVRGQPESSIDTTQFLHGFREAELPPLLPLQGMSYAALRHFLDLKGRRRFKGARLLRPPAAEGGVSDSAGKGLESITTT